MMLLPPRADFALQAHVECRAFEPERMCVFITAGPVIKLCAGGRIVR
jgi:hypothetical protein